MALAVYNAARHARCCMTCSANAVGALTQALGGRLASGGRAAVPAAGITCTMAWRLRSRRQLRQLHSTRGRRASGSSSCHSRCTQRMLSSTAAGQCTLRLGCAMCEQACSQS